MTVIRTLRPGAAGTKKYHRRYREKLVAVRYRRDDDKGYLYTTVELVVDVRTLPRPDADLARIEPGRTGDVVAVKIGFEDRKLRSKIKLSGGKWNREYRVWLLSYNQAMMLGLEEYIVPHLAEKWIREQTAVYYVA